MSVWINTSSDSSVIISMIDLDKIIRIPIDFHIDQFRVNSTNDVNLR